MKSRVEKTSSGRRSRSTAGGGVGRGVRRRRGGDLKEEGSKGEGGRGKGLKIVVRGGGI